MSEIVPDHQLTAPELYARCLGLECSGNHACHFCGSPSTQKYGHDDLPPTVGVRSKSLARRAGNPWMCVGCHAWRKQKRITVNWLDGGQKDGAWSANHSWLIIDQPWHSKELERRFDPGPWGIRFDGFKILYRFLLKPLGRWCLTLRADCKTWLTGKKGDAYQVPDPTLTASENMLHVAEANDVKEVLAGSEFKFTLNNVVHSYSPYELEQGLRHGKEGKEPGVRVLIELLGPFPLPPEPPKPGYGTKGHPHPDTGHQTLGKKLK